MSWNKWQIISFMSIINIPHHLIISKLIIIWWGILIFDRNWSLCYLFRAILVKSIIIHLTSNMHLLSSMCKHIPLSMHMSLKQDHHPIIGIQLKMQAFWLSSRLFIDAQTNNQTIDINNPLTITSQPHLTITSSLRLGLWRGGLGGEVSWYWYLDPNIVNNDDGHADIGLHPHHHGIIIIHLQSIIVHITSSALKLLIMIMMLNSLRSSTSS